MQIFGLGEARVKDYAVGLYDLDGYHMRRRRQKLRSLIDKTAEVRTYVIKDYIIPLWGDIALSKMTVKLIDERLVNVRSVKYGRELSGVYKNEILIILDDIFRAAIEDGAINTNPVKSVMRFSHTITNPRGAIPKEEMALLFPPSHDDLLKIWKNQVHAVAYLILRDTGLRPGELRALQWGDWYPDLCFFPITKAIESGKQDKIKSTKTGSVKPAVVTEQTATEIEILRKNVKDYSPERFIFAGKKYGVFSIYSLVYNFRQGVLRAGLNRPEYSPYWLRHTFNTRMLDILPDDMVRLLMGHATEAMTRHYRHPDIESLKREAKKIQAVLNSIGG